MKVIRGASTPLVPASHEDPNNPGTLKKVLLTAQDLFPGQVQMVNWAEMKPGSSFRRHYHEDMAEVFIIVQGEGRMRGDSTDERVSPGDLVLVPPMVEHEMHVCGDQALKYIVFGVSHGTGGKTVVVS